MKQVLIRQGQAVVEDVPAPLIEPGAVLVRVVSSCISVGTEMSGLRASGMPLWKRALQKPEKVKTVLRTIAADGFTRTRDIIRSKLEAGTPTGYSLAGVVLQTGDGVHDLRAGDRVACAGAQCAHHAEIVCVPRNLVVAIPDSVGFAEASTVTLGAIAMQSVRRASPTLGECFVVIGLGIIGQLTVQLLKANGCRVTGTDLDHQRVQGAINLGMDAGESGDGLDEVFRLTGGIGADGVIIAAATASDDVLSTAFKMCRKKGRVVLVGDVGLELKRQDFYEKELDFFISTSCGPGRYDPHYEQQGLDYPIGYVRWTENRNMCEYLRLLSEGKVRVSELAGATYPISRATEAYAALHGDAGALLMVLLSYPETASSEHKIAISSARPAVKDRIRVAVVGAGAFVKAVHLPNLQRLSSAYIIQSIVSRTGHNAAVTARQFGCAYSSTDFADVVRDPEIDAVLIATRHHLHAGLVLQALQAGKNVLVEKPLALTASELDRITRFFSLAGDGAPILLTGFNRRFSRYAREVHRQLQGRTNPVLINYRVNAGYVPPEHWVHGIEGGGRNRGEACHIYDLFTFLTGSKVVSVEASSLRPATSYYSSRDNFVAMVSFADGSVASLTYTALGSRDHPKEQMEVFVDGKVFVLDDYKRLTAAEGKEVVSTRTPDKGHLEELESFAAVLRKGGEWPIPLWQQVQATEMALQVEDCLNR